MGSRPIGISASRGAAILGLSGFKSRVEIWRDLMEEIYPGYCEANKIEPPKPVDSAALRWGSAFEETVILLAEKKIGMAIGDKEKYFEDIFERGDGKRDLKITCHLDGTYDGLNYGLVNHEGKTTSAFAFREKWGEPGTDRVPREYAVQVQHQMMLSKSKQTIISVLVFPARVEEYEEAGCDPQKIDRVNWGRVLYEMGCFHQYIIDADPQLQNLMLDEYLRFWDCCIVGKTPPPIETWNDIKILLPEPRGTIVASEQQERWSSEYAQINAEISMAKKQQEKLKTLLISEIEREAEHPIDNDSVEALILRNQQGHKIASYAKEKSGKKVFRCGG
jgi:hypothetical protein